MKTYTFQISIFGVARTAKVQANDTKEAERKMREAVAAQVRVTNVQAEDNSVEFLKGFFGMK